MTDSVTLPTPAMLSPEGQAWLEELMGEFQFDQVAERVMTGNLSYDGRGLLERVIRLFAQELYLNAKMMAALVGIVIFCAVALHLQNGFGRKGVEQASTFLCYGYVAAISAGCFSRAVTFAASALADVTVMMQVLVPSMTTLMVAGGVPTTGSVMHPLLFFLCQGVGALIQGVIVPMALCAMALSLFDGISDSVRLGGMADFLFRLHRYLLSGSMILFVAVLSVSRFAATAFDSVAARGVRFAVSSLVPVVGGSISEAMGSVAGAAKLLRNSVGTVGVVALFAVYLMPVLKIGAIVFLYRLTGAVISPIADGRLTALLGQMAECLSLLLTSLICAAVLMIVSLVAVMGT